MKGELRKNQILDGAKKLIARNGYYGTHVEDILREVKIGKGTFYLYFKNKEDLFISILERFLDEWEEVVLAVTTEPGQRDLQTYFQAVITRSLHFFKRNEHLCNIYLRIGPGISEIFEPYIERFEQRMLKYVIDELKKGVHAGFFRKDLDIEITANIIVGAHLRLAYYYFVVKKRKRVKPSIDQISDEFFKMIIKGLSP
jgi:TetR/AcrR family transcriptional regulator, fatty acid metabolism regulator protein